MEHDTNEINHIAWKQTLLSNLIILQRVLKDPLLHTRDLNSVAELQERLQSEVFKVAVVGEFKRGKSTLINALLGREILPADVLPCSATLNRVAYGLQPKVVLHYKPTSEDAAPLVEEIGIDELSDYVTKLTPESEKKAEDIEEAVIYYPTKYCRDQAEIIDTPGLNDSSSMTEVTMKVLPEVDACILVILAQAPFSAYEANFLKNMLTHDLGKVIFVVNRIDEIRRAKDRQRVVQLVTTRIQNAIEERVAEIYEQGSSEYERELEKIGTPKVFPVSGGLALDAKIEDDQDLLIESQFSVFEDALQNFLTIEKGVLILERTGQQMLKKMDDALSQVALRVGSLSMEQEQFEHSFVMTQQRLEELNTELLEITGGYVESKANLLEALKTMLHNSQSSLLNGIESDILDLDLTLDEATGEKEIGLLKVQEAAEHRFKINCEKLMLSVTEMIQSQVGKELQTLEHFAQKAHGVFTAIQQDFIQEDESILEGLAVGVLTAAVRFHNPFWSLASGAVSGYKVAGVKGAAVGGVTGAVAGVAGFYGTAIAGLYTAGYFMALTNPVVLTIAGASVVVSGISAWYGGRMATELFFGEDAILEFKQESGRTILDALEQQLPSVTAELEQQVHQMVTNIYAELSQEIQRSFGDSIAQTETLLEQLKNDRLSIGVDLESQRRSTQVLHEDLSNLYQSTSQIMADIYTLKQNMERTV